MISPERCTLTDKEYTEFLILEEKVDQILKSRLFYGHELRITANELSETAVTPKVKKLLLKSYIRSGWKVDIQYAITDPKIEYWIFNI